MMAYAFVKNYDYDMAGKIMINEIMINEKSKQNTYTL